MCKRLKPLAPQGHNMANAEPIIRIQTNNEIAEPVMFKVIYMNDNNTPVDFVIESLVNFFNYNQDTAQKVTIDIHESGAAVVAILPYEIAEQKGIEVTVEARKYGFPLQVKLEPDHGS